MRDIDLDAEPLRYTGYLIRRAQQAHAAGWSRLVSKQISSVQYSVLTTLERLGAVSQRKLCDEVDLDRSTIADLVQRMEQRGLISRERSATDARSNTVALTDAGREEAARLQPSVAALEEQLTGALSDEETSALRSGLRKLLASQPESR